MRIGLLSGDPSGIGPEVSAKLLATPEVRAQAEIVLVGDREVFRSGANAAGLPAGIIDDFPCIESRLETNVPMARVSSEAGAFTLGTLRRGAEAIERRDIDALVYAPLNKQAMKLAGMAEEDEMHHLAALLRHSGLCSEINIAGAVWTTRVTSHIPLRAVAASITEPRVYDAILLIDGVMRADRGIIPRIAVAGLNPHAGEGGLLGTEEIETIGPAVRRARADGIDAHGPLPADTLFIAARRGDYHAVVSMYHDQGQIATKLLGFERGVTLHAGLPAPITTPAHGTAFDIAGKGVANAGPIVAAFEIAARMAAAAGCGA